MNWYIRSILAQLFKAMLYLTDEFIDYLGKRVYCVLGYLSVVYVEGGLEILLSFFLCALLDCSL